jgi:LAO/AO transport system kinase
VSNISTDDLYDGVLAGNRSSIGRAITLVESVHPDHRERAQELLRRLLPHTGSAHRVGITGVPGVGKSTFIDELGSRLTATGHQVAVLAVDPTSTRTGGSILGDKTRMARLGNDDAAFVRPSPTAGTLGGVSRRTRESATVVEAAGYDVILIETVGVGQSETVVAEMVDMFVVLMLPGAGDELQGIKKGILELADLIAVNKADGDNEAAARHAAADYSAALRLMVPASLSWTPRVQLCSGLTGDGVDEVWASVMDHRAVMTESGELIKKREQQRVQWMWATVEDRVTADLRGDPATAALIDELESQVRKEMTTPTTAAEQLVAAFRSTS